VQYLVEFMYDTMNRIFYTVNHTVLILSVSPVSLFVSGHWRISKKALMNFNTIGRLSSRAANDYFTLLGQHQTK